MVSDPPPPIDRQPEKPKNNSVKRLFLFGRKILYEEQPLLKHTFHFLGEEGKGLKKGWLLFAVIAVILLILGNAIKNRQLEKNQKEAAEALTNTNLFYHDALNIASNILSQTNAYLNGKLETQKEETAHLRTQFDDYRHESETQIFKLRADVNSLTNEINEIKREKDAEISKLSVGIPEKERQLVLLSNELYIANRETSNHMSYTWRWNMYNHFGIQDFDMSNYSEAAFFLGRAREIEVKTYPTLKSFQCDVFLVTARFLTNQTPKGEQVFRKDIDDIYVLNIDSSDYLGKFQHDLIVSIKPAVKSNLWSFIDEKTSTIQKRREALLHPQQ